MTTNLTAPQAPVVLETRLQDMQLEAALSPRTQRQAHTTPPAVALLLAQATCLSGRATNTAPQSSALHSNRDMAPVVATRASLPRNTYHDAASSANNTSNTTGTMGTTPHSSSLLNKLDPRVDSGAGTTSSSPQVPGAYPSSSSTTETPTQNATISTACTVGTGTTRLNCNHPMVALIRIRVGFCTARAVGIGTGSVIWSREVHGDVARMRSDGLRIDMIIS